MLLRVILVSAICCCSGNATAGDDALVIENARVIVGDGAVQDNVSVTIREGRIQSVHEATTQVASAGRIDARGMTVLPGLIDVHVHLLWPSATIDGGRGERAFRQDLVTDLPGRLQEFVRHGVTTVKSTGEMFAMALELRSSLADGRIKGPRLVIVGPVFTAPGGHPAGTIFRDDPWAKSEHCVQVNDPTEAREHVRRVAARGVDAIKLMYQGGAYPEYFGDDVKMEKLRAEVMQAIIDEAHRQNLRATVHTWHEEDALAVVQAGADGLEHGVADAVLATDRLADALRMRNAFYVPTLTVVRLSRDTGSLTIAQQNLKKLSDRGVRIAVGTDTQGGMEATPPGRNTIREMELMVEAGLTTEQVIRAGTRDAAEHLGLLDKLGTVEIGKLADIIIVEGDPLKDISALRQIRFVIQSGRIVHSPSGE